MRAASKRNLNANGIQTALTAAEGHKNAGGPDQVLIGAGSYTREEGFSYIGEAIVIRGAGAGSTTLSRGGPEGRDVFALAAISASEPSLSGVTIVVPAIKDMTGLGLASGLVESVKIESPVGASVAGGLALEGSGVFSHGTIDVLDGTGVEQRGGEVLYTTIFGAGFGVQASTQATLRGRHHLRRQSAGVLLLQTAGDRRQHHRYARGRQRGRRNRGQHQRLDPRLPAPGRDACTGGEHGPGCGGRRSQTATVLLENSIDLRSGNTPVSVYSAGSGVSASLSADYSSFDMLTSRKKAGAGATSSLVAEHLLSAVPAFVSPLTGDFRLAPGSPLIDAGTPGELGLGELATDLAGNPRIVHGRRDVGPYEYQWHGPVISSATAGTSTPIVGQSVTFSGSATVAEPGDAITSYQWSFDDGATVPAGAGATHSFTTSGPHTATLTVTDSIGLTASTTVTLTASGQIQCAVRACGCGELAGRCPPFRLRISGLRLKPKSFRAARKGASRAPIGSRIDYSLNGSALVTFSVQRALNGVRHGKSCMAPRRGLHGKSCRRTIAMRGSFSHCEPAGCKFAPFLRAR